MSLLLDAIRMVAAVELPCSVSVKSPKRKNKNPAVVLLWGIIEKSYCPYIHYKSIGLAYEKLTMLLISRVFMSNVYDALFFLWGAWSRLIGRKSQSTDDHDSFENEIIMEGDDDCESDDERPDSVDDKVRQKEMRKGIDLATTLERIEKNFVITDPRLPDNPIVSFLKNSFHILF